MIMKYTKLHNIELSLEVAIENRNALFDAVKEYTENFLNNLSEQRAYVNNNTETYKTGNPFKIDGTAKSIEELLELIDEYIKNTGINAASGGHLGYIPGGGIYTAALGDFIAAILNPYAGVFFASPGAVQLENTLINWAGNLLGFNGDFGGNLTSGGSIANLIAISAAKTAKKINSKNVGSSVIYTTQQNHHSIQKALLLLGLDECIVHNIPLDAQYRMDVKELQKQLINDKAKKLNPFLVIANAGSTDVGAIDPLLEIGAIRMQENIWLHIDAAYGGFFILTEYGKKRLKGIEHADSVILDPHKSLFLPYGSGMVLVKNVKTLAEANSYKAAYMQDAKDWTQQLSPADLSPELSKHFRGLRMWMPLQLHGTKPFKDCLNEKLELTRYFCTKINQLGFELGNTPDLTIVIYRYNPKNENREAYNRRILKSIHENGCVFISSTEINGEFWLRAAILSFRTHKKEVDKLIGLLSSFVNLY